MKSLRELFRIGKGPSSSHTMGPDNAARIYAKRHPEAKSFEVTLYGSLAATGKGHMTDVAIIDVLSKIAPVNIIWQPKVFLPFHPNGMKFTADGGDEWTVYSVGGGALSEGKAEGDMFAAGGDVYDMHKIKDIMAWCNKATFYAITSDGNHRISFDHVVEVMKRTGHDLPSLYKETSEGGLALEYKD